MYFNGDTDGKFYELDLKLLRDIAPEKTKYIVKANCIEIVLEKAEKCYWNRLLKSKGKQHWLKVDSQKWKEEDDSEDDAADVDLKNMIKKMNLLKQNEHMKDALKGPEDPTASKRSVSQNGILIKSKKNIAIGEQTQGMSRDFKNFLSQQNPNKVGDMMKNAESKMVKMFGLPEIHLEYSKRFKNEKKHIEKLKTLCNTIFSYGAMTSKIGNENLIAMQIEERQETELIDVMFKRWGNKVFDPSFLQRLDQVPVHTIFDQKTENFNFKKFQTMKNHVVPEWIYEYGKTHVSIGCADFSQLLFGKLDNKDSSDPLVFIGIDSSVVSIARCWILYQMIRNKVNPRSILQVWFSSAWTDEAQKDFLQSVEELVAVKDTNIKENIKELLNYWLKSKLASKTSQDLWSKHFLKDHVNKVFEPCVNLKKECDRVDYARYLLTGTIFADENQVKHGNITMFCIPENLGVCKVDDEDFFNTFNFFHEEFSYRDSLMKSVERFMMDKTENLIQLISLRKLDMKFKAAQIGTKSKDLLREIKDMKPYTVDWSNIPDYFCREEFLQMARAASTDETVHYFHMMNWVQNYKGASVFDYSLEGKVQLVTNGINAFKNAHAFLYGLETYRSMWTEEIKCRNDLNVIDFFLARDCGEKYLKHFLGNGIEFSLAPQNYGQFHRSGTTMRAGITFDENIEISKKTSGII